MALSKIKTIAFAFLLLTVAGKINAVANTANFHSVYEGDSLNLPPLNKFVGREVEILLGLIDSQNYEKSYIVTPQGILSGIIMRFKLSDVALHVYLSNPKPYNSQTTPDPTVLINKDVISRIEVYNENKFVTVFNQECLTKR
jgi:hypothetical protein